MRTVTTCSWCHTTNDAEQRDCVGCGHDAHVPRSQCRCSACTATVPLGDTGLTVTLAAPDSVRSRLAEQRIKARCAAASKLDHLALGYVLQYVIYFNLVRWPGQYALRSLSVHNGAAFFETRMPLAVHADLSKIRSLIPGGYINAGRAAKDAACVVEIWV